MKSTSLLVEDLNLVEQLDNQTAECVGGGHSTPQKILVVPGGPPRFRRRCPPGWIPARPPLNPLLGCIPNIIVSNSLND
jgi:hypothetical protein